MRWTAATPGLADGVFHVDAKGYMAASLHWANELGPLPDWTALGYLPLDACGRGSFQYTGGRGIPSEATHVAAKLISPDFAKTEIILKKLPAGGMNPVCGPGTRFAVMSDLHMTGKTGRVRRAFQLARQADCVLLAGDLTADASEEQFARLARIMEEELPDIPVLAVAGNHDYPLVPVPRIPQGADDWPSFQTRLLDRARGMGVACEEEPCGAWRARLNGVDVFGLRAVSHWRRFVFPRGEQLDWLEEQLEKSRAKNRIILCHAPLLRHNPTRDAGDCPAYLSRDERLQQIMDAHRNVCFISGHTHVSLSEWKGCVEYDASRNHVYFNDGSVVANMTRTRETLTSGEWTDGTVSFLTLCVGNMEISARAISSGKHLARGYYRFQDGREQD